MKRPRFDPGPFFRTRLRFFYFGVTLNRPPGNCLPASTRRHPGLLPHRGCGGRHPNARPAWRRPCHRSDAVQRHGRHAAHQARAIPLREHRAFVEDQVARRDDGRPIDHGLGQVGARVGAGDRHAVIVGGVGHQRPAVILALLDQVQLVAALGAMLDFPQASIGREGQAIGRAMAGAPGLGRRQVRSRESIGAHHRRGLGRFGIGGRIDQGNGSRAGLVRRTDCPARACRPASGAKSCPRAGWDPAPGSCAGGRRPRGKGYCRRARTRSARPAGRPCRLASAATAPRSRSAARGRW